jgi:glycosyltransferase involved in cell wall biosynthesis
VGGAERLTEALDLALRRAGHQVERRELALELRPRRRAIEQALWWRVQDLENGNFDCIVVTKFPAYALRHRRKVVWLYHQLREVYDLWGTTYSAWSEEPEERAVRDAIQTLDRRALGECAARFAISGTVAQRLRRWTGLDAEVLHPPLLLAQDPRCVAYEDFFLLAGRLERAKRIDLALEALARMRHPAPVVVAGRGPEAERLKARAAALGLAERVCFAGFVGEEELGDLYARCRGVLAVPLEEDFGLVAAEALAARKPVVTCSDSGGLLELVEDGRSGFVVDPEPESLAAALDRLAAAPGLAARLGEVGEQKARASTWDLVLARLLG